MMLPNVRIAAPAYETKSTPAPELLPYKDADSRARPKEDKDSRISLHRGYEETTF